MHAGARPRHQLGNHQWFRSDQVPDLPRQEGGELGARTPHSLVVRGLPLRLARIWHALPAGCQPSARALVHHMRHTAFAEWSWTGLRRLITRRILDPSVLSELASVGGTMATRVGTVAFFEIVRAKDALNARMEHSNWQTFLESLENTPAAERICTHRGDSFIGQAVRTDGLLHLLVGRIGASELQTVDLDHGHIEDIRLEGNKGTIDTTTVSFLDFGNVIGILQGRPGSPRASAIQRWLNSCQIAEHEIALWPVIANNVWEKLEKATAVHSFEFSYRPSPAIATPEGEGLSSFVRLGDSRYPDHKITLKIEIPRKDGPGPVARLRGQRRLRGDIQSLMTELGYLEGTTGVERARALVTLPDGEGEENDEPLDFMKHHITAKCRVEVNSVSGGPRYVANVAAIMQVARDRQRDIRAAVSADQ